MTDVEITRQYHQERAEKHLAAREAARLEWLDRAREAILRLAPGYADVRRVYLFGSVTQPGRFHRDSDIDVAVVCNPAAAAAATESALWRALEQALQRDVDLRPLVDPIDRSVALTGELVYER